MAELNILVSDTEWPMAVYRGPMNRPAGYFICETPFSTAAERDGAHGPVTLIILRYNVPGKDPFVGRRMEYTDQKFARVHHAVQFLMHFLDKNPAWRPTLI